VIIGRSNGGWTSKLAGRTLKLSQFSGLDGVVVVFDGSLESFGQF